MNGDNIKPLGDIKRVTLMIPEELDEVGNIFRTRLGDNHLERSKHHDVNNNGNFLFITKEFQDLKQMRDYISKILLNSDSLSRKYVVPPRYLESVTILGKGPYEICTPSMEAFQKSSLSEYVRIRETQGDDNRRGAFILTVKARSLKDLLGSMHNKLIQILGT